MQGKRQSINLEDNQTLRQAMGEFGDIIQFNGQSYVPGSQIGFRLSESLEKLLAFKWTARGYVTMDLESVERVKIFKKTDFHVKTSLPVIKYTDDQHVFKIVKESLHGFKDLLKVAYDSLTAKIGFTIEEGFTLTISDSISYFLGFAGKTVFSGLATARVPICINYRSNTLFVNCSIVTHSIVSHVHARILRVIPLEYNNPDSQIYKCFTDEQYFSVDSDFVETVHVTLLTEFGEKLPLRDSSLATWITLLFKK